MKRISSLYILDLFLDSNGVLRVGGRIKKVNLIDGFKIFIILSKVGYVITLIIRYVYEKI